MSEDPQHVPDPLRDESDMFRILIAIILAAAVVILLAVLISSTVGALVGGMLILYGLWRFWLIVRAWWSSAGEKQKERERRFLEDQQRR